MVNSLGHKPNYQGEYHVGNVGNGLCLQTETVCVGSDTKIPTL